MSTLHPELQKEILEMLLNASGDKKDAEKPGDNDAGNRSSQNTARSREQEK